MGTRTTQQNALLDVLLKYKKWIFSFLVLVALAEGILSFINHAHQKTVWKSIATLLRNEINSANSYQISRALSDMEKVGWIKCVTLTEATNEARIFYDTTTQSYCGFFTTKTEGILTAINGSTWQMSFTSSENIWLLTLRIIIPFLVFFGLLYAYQIIDRQNKQQEAGRLRVIVEKEYLFDLAKQTRHDIASPIGALKLVIQKLQAPPEYIELLQNITERIDGIFSQLNNLKEDFDISSVKVPLAIISVNNCLSRIIIEKETQWRLPPEAITADVPAIEAIGNEVELERIFSNLLNNAIEAKKESTPLQIHVTSIIKEKFCLIKIQDNGNGMSADTLSKVGIKGFSLGKSKTNSGLGLYHAKETLRAFGGDLTLDSTLGAGTTVTLHLKRS